MANLLQLIRISQEGVDSVKDSFNHLPHTGHADGEYRLRVYSAIKAYIGNIQVLDNATFNQSSKYNKFQGDVDRKFQSIDELVLRSAGLREICNVFMKVNRLSGGHEIEVHQMRIKTLPEHVERHTPVSPEGVHQDGYDYIAMVGINRHNVVGGEVLVHKSRDDEPFMTFCLESGDMILLNDKEFWHNANTIVGADGEGTIGYMDAFILTARK